ncbi:hypothetical protein [Streptacidiphilus neutrinimicus]|uniref:hypothetical protein n=1 Tax=Streptacidiphilus neutrinimicus TaxID=105420 RepID=UPI0005A8A085|nr:hypothetical protein [Streptacidiphilus neutrinimicus]
MYCEFIAERGQRTGGTTRVARWHVVRQDQHAALCGQVLAHDAETVPIADPHAIVQGGVCPACWNRYRSLP